MHAPALAPLSLIVALFFQGIASAVDRLFSIVHIAAVRSVIADAVVDRLDLGSTDATGDILFTTSADAALVTCNLANPAFGAASSGVATANTIAAGTATAAGTIARAQFRDRNNAEQFRLTNVNTAGGDINLTSLTIAIGETLTITSFSYTAPT